MKELLEKYRQLSKPIKASMWFVISNIMLKGMSFITLPIFSRILTTSEYGVVSVYQSWVSTISILCTLTIWGGVFNVGMVKYQERQKEMISSFQGMATTLTLAFLLLSSIVLPWLSEWFGMSGLLIVLMYVEILTQIPFNIWATEQRYRFEYKKLIWITVISSVLNPILGYIAVVHATHKAEARIVSNLLIQVIIAFFLFASNQKLGRKFFSKEFWKFGFRFNIVLVPHYFSTQILNQSDRLMINNMCGSSDAGIYSIAYNFAMLLSLVTSGINSSLTPHVYQSIKTEDTSKLHKQVTGVVAFVAIIVVGLICIVPDIFTLLLPESYYPALNVIPPVALGAFFLFLYPLFGAIEFYYEENKYITYASVVGAVMNIVLNYIFINIYGFVAAAYTTLVCYMCYTICHYFFMKKILKKRNVSICIYNVKALTIISMVVLLVSFAVMLVYEYTLIRWCIILVICTGILIKRKMLVDMLSNFRKG